MTLQIVVERDTWQDHLYGQPATKTYSRSLAWLQISPLHCVIGILSSVATQTWLSALLAGRQFWTQPKRKRHQRNLKEAESALLLSPPPPPQCTWREEQSGGSSLFPPFHLSSSLLPSGHHYPPTSRRKPNLCPTLEKFVGLILGQEILESTLLKERWLVWTEPTGPEKMVCKMW